jgi:hypothetical protein
MPLVSFRSQTLNIVEELFWDGMCTVELIDYMGRWNERTCLTKIGEHQCEHKPRKVGFQSSTEYSYVDEEHNFSVQIVYVCLFVWVFASKPEKSSSPSPPLPQPVALTISIAMGFGFAVVL